MASDNLTKLRNELEKALATLLPQIEGLEDFNRLNIQDETRLKVTETLAAFMVRRDRINETLATLGGLEEDSYPILPNVEVAQEIYNDLKDNVSTIAAAFAKFDSETAATLGAKVGDPELK